MKSIIAMGVIAVMTVMAANPARGQSYIAYKFVFNGFAYQTNGAGNIVTTPITDQTLLQSQAQRLNIADLSTVSLVYHIGGAEQGDTVDVVSNATGQTLTTEFGLLFGPDYPGQSPLLGRYAVTNATQLEQRRVDQVYTFSDTAYTYQSDESLGGSFTCKRFLFDGSGNTNAFIDGTLFWDAIPTQGNVGPVLCAGHFTLGAPKFQKKRRSHSMKWRVIWPMAAAFLFGWLAPKAKADSTWVYAVQITAQLETNPPSITLNWIQDMYGAKSYTVYRKSKEATDWGTALVQLDGSVTNFTDTNVQIGQTYEYQVAKDATLGYKGFGYIYSGIEAPLIEDRGVVILVVATNSAFGLSDELSQLQSDLIGDGWGVICENVSSNDTPPYVRSLIMNDYNADPADVNAVFLFGHVPILESGYLNYDGHYTRAMPADTYYGEMNNDWPVPANPTNGPSYIPSDVVLEVGRVDMFNMIGQGASVPWPNEQDLLRNYLIKDHNWRIHQIPVERQALMGDRRGDVDGTLGMAASGYRNFTPFVGAAVPLAGVSNIIEANIEDNAPIPQRWISMLDTATNYLWAFGDGGGELNGCTYLGTNGEYNEVLSTDIVGADAQAVFVMLFGSYMGNWDGQDDLLRSVLATPTMGLACMMVGEPHWFVHHMGLGETIGYGTRLTVNNSTLYQSASNALMRAVYINLMGDPTLRQDPVAPPVGLQASSAPGIATLNWAPGADAVLGYNVYVSSSPAGPFTRLNDALVTGTSCQDTESSPGTYYYMVRGVRLETNPSGSYYNASEGVFASANITVLAPPITVGLALQSGGLVLSWNTASGASYRVWASPVLSPPNWRDISGAIIAGGTNATWNVSIGNNSPQCYFEITSP